MAGCFSAWLVGRTREIVVPVVSSPSDEPLVRLGWKGFIASQAHGPAFGDAVPLTIHRSQPVSLLIPYASSVCNMAFQSRFACRRQVQTMSCTYKGRCCGARRYKMARPCREMVWPSREAFCGGRGTASATRPAIHQNTCPPCGTRARGGRRRRSQSLVCL